MIPVTPKGPRRWHRWGLLVGVLAFAVWLMSAAHAVLLPFVIAFVLAYLLAPVVEALVVHGHLHRVVGIVLVYGLVGLIMALLIVYFVPTLVAESLRLIKFVPQLAQDVQGAWNYWLSRFHQQPMPPAIRGAISGTAKHLQTRLLSALNGTVHAAFGLVPGLLSFLIAPILSFYVLKDLPRIKEKFWALVPVTWRGGVYKLGYDIDRALNGYIRGQLMVALAVGVLSAIWMIILHIRFALLIGAVAAITDIIPYVGPVAGAIPAIALGLMRSPWVALYAVLGFIVIHQLEGTVISPKVVGESVGLHPLIVIFAILAGGEVDGFFGLLMAVPVAAVIKVVVAHGYRRLTVSLDRDSTPSVQ